LAEAQDTVVDSGTETRQWNFNTVAAVLFIILAVALFFIIPHQTDKPMIMLGLSQTNLPPELLPQVVTVCFFALGNWYLYKSFSLKQSNDLLKLDREAWTNVTVTLIIMGIYVPLMVNLGFVVGSAIMVMVMSTYFGNRNYWLAGLISIAIPMLMFWVFRTVLVTQNLQEIDQGNW
jgi:hypothetical protein